MYIVKLIIRTNKILYIPLRSQHLTKQTNTSHFRGPWCATCAPHTSENAPSSGVSGEAGAGAPSQRTEAHASREERGRRGRAGSRGRELVTSSPKAIVGVMRLLEASRSHVSS